MTGLSLGLGLALGSGSGGASVPAAVATLGRMAGHNSALADGTNTQLLNRSVHRTGRRAASQIQIGVANFKLLGVSPFGEAATGGDATVSAIVEMADGTLYPATFSGATSVVLAAGSSVVFTDALPVSIPADTEFFVRLWYRVASTAIALAAAQTVSVASKQIARKGTDLSAAFATAGYPTGLTSTQIPPVAIKGILAGAAMVLGYFGDSIGDGSADNTTDMTNGETSFIGRSTVSVNGFNLPHMKMTRGGETLAALADVVTGARRRALFSAATHILGNPGTNDITQGRTFAQMQADYIAVWTAAKSAGAYTIQTTILPRVTFAGSVQTIFTNFGPGGIRDQINTWLLAQEGLGLLDKIVDIRHEVEDVAGNPGYWKNGLSDTADGTHPLPVAHARVSDNVLRPVLSGLEAAYTT